MEIFSRFFCLSRESYLERDEQEAMWVRLLEFFVPTHIMSSIFGDDALHNFNTKLKYVD